MTCITVERAFFRARSTAQCCDSSCKGLMMGSAEGRLTLGVQMPPATATDRNSRMREVNAPRIDGTVEQHFVESDAKWERFLGNIDKRFDQLEVKIDHRAAAMERRLLAWMFMFWTGSTLSTAGLLFAMLHGR